MRYQPGELASRDGGGRGNSPAPICVVCHNHIEGRDIFKAHELLEGTAHRECCPCVTGD